MKLRLAKRGAVLVSAGALALTAIPMLAGSAGASGMQVYTIGVEGPFSGPDAFLGNYIYGGVELAVNAANASGTNKFTLKAEKFDDQCSGSLAPAEAQKAVATANLVGVVGPTCSGAAETAAKYYDAAHVAEVSASATAVALATGSDSSFFRTVADDSVQGGADAKYLVDDQKVTNLLVIGDGSFYGDGLASVVAADAKADGATVTTETIPNVNSGGGGTTTQYGPDATAIATSDPGAIFYGGYYSDFGLLLGALYEAGYTTSSHVIMSGDGSNEPALVTDTSPADAANNVYVSESAAGKVNYFTGKLATEYYKLTHYKANTAEYAAQAYDATNAIIKALDKASLPAKLNSSSLTKLRKSVVANLHTVSFVGVTGPIAFQGDGNLKDDSGSVSISQVQSGTIKQVTTVNQ